MMLGMRLLSLLFLFCIAHSLCAEDGHEAWLRYAPLPRPIATVYASLPGVIVAGGNSPVEESAARELARGLGSMLSRSFVAASADGGRSRIELRVDPALAPDAFRIARSRRGVDIVAGNAQGELYGAFHLLEMVASARPLTMGPLVSAPSAPIRWVDQWDNLDGSIERGYAGRSIFFADGHVRSDLTRVAEYGRLLASIGINGITINNVNADPRILEPARLAEFARIADALRPWGVRIALAVDLSSPEAVGHLGTFDPLDPGVAAWWSSTADSIYKVIPDFGGFVVKADSEGQPGPSQYGRTPAEAANVLARALARHHGMVLYRAFVYDHHLDWNNLKADRARAGYDNFHPLDGKFAANVVIQVKNGPIDFQVREPVSPLFAGLRHTSQAIELETTQEYTGQQRHMVYLVPMWKTALDTDMRAGGRSTTVKSIVEGKAFDQPTGGFVSVVNVGLDINWMHHPMALANLYGFGKLAWDPNQSAESIVDTWTRLTFGNDPAVVRTIDALQMGSWRAYEDYTGSLGMGTLTDILHHHYGPNVGSAEHNGWGQWIRAEHDGVGMDRTVATGTGYIGQYPPELAAIYESLASCPDNLLLFMHHVPYTYRLHSGETVIQHIYNAHYEGAAIAATYAPRWQTLKGKIDAERYSRVLGLFLYQAGHAIVWRDAVTEWFAAKSGIPDELHRVGNYPNRIEAESMRANGYRTVAVTPAETASGGHAVVCNQPVCTLSAAPHREGRFRVAVQYFDLRSGVSRYELLQNGSEIASWRADDQLPPDGDDPNLDGSTSTRFTSAAITLRPEDTLELRGTPDGGEPAPVDYIELIPLTGR